MFCGISEGSPKTPPLPSLLSAELFDRNKIQMFDPSIPKT